MKTLKNHHDANVAYLFAALQKLIDEHGGRMTVVIPKPSDGQLCFNSQVTIEHNENETKLIFISDNQEQGKE
jgi:hypothetical protein